MRQGQGEEDRRKACGLDFKTLQFSGKDNTYSHNYFSIQTMVGTPGEFILCVCVCVKVAFLYLFIYFLL